MLQKYYRRTDLLIFSFIVGIIFFLLHLGCIEQHKMQHPSKDGCYKNLEKLTIEQLTDMLGHNFNKKEFISIFFHNPGKAEIMGGPASMNFYAGLALMDLLIEKPDIDSVNDLLQKSLDSGNWLKFCALSEIAARSCPDNKHLLTLLKAYHFEQSEETREAILLALEYYIRHLNKIIPITEDVLTYISGPAIERENSIRCIAQLSRVYARIIGKMHCSEMDESGFLVRKKSALLDNFENSN